MKCKKDTVPQGASTGPSNKILYGSVAVAIGAVALRKVINNG